MEAAPTWIDAGVIGEWQSGLPARFDRTDRWFVFLHESHAAFVVLSGNAGHGSFGGEDTGYSAAEVASAIERWGTPVAGLEACPEFLEALEHHALHTRATGTPLDVIRADYLLAAIRARVAIAAAADAKPFARYGQCSSTNGDDDEDLTIATCIVPWGDEE